MGNPIPGSAENWERGELGLNRASARAASPEETAAITQAAGLNMQPISIRLPKDLVSVLKEIADYRGVGYQPMIRDLLQRWATGEISTILDERAMDAKRKKAEIEQNESLAGDLRKFA